MITDAGKALVDKILETARANDRTANAYAVKYAESDDRDYKATFEKYSSIANTYNNIYTLVCQGIHAVEAEMQKKCGDA